MLILAAHVSKAGMAGSHFDAGRSIRSSGEPLLSASHGAYREYMSPWPQLAIQALSTYQRSQRQTIQGPSLQPRAPRRFLTIIRFNFIQLVLHGDPERHRPCRKTKSEVLGAQIQPFTRGVSRVSLYENRYGEHARAYPSRAHPCIK